MADDSTDDLGSMAAVLGALAYAPGGPGDAAALAPGTVIDGVYRIERAIGEGGMGAVYLARDQRLGRAVALKLGHAVSRDALARMSREAGALAMLSHPNVVVVHQVGEHDGRVYLAMEYVAGTTLRGWLAARTRTWREIVAVVTAAGDGLAAAHTAGLVHRDVKPDNVLVGDDGRPRIADFGLARAAIASDDAAHTDDASTNGVAAARTDDAPTDDDAAARTDDAPAAGIGVTETGAVLGTPAYMAPEQLDGDELDARADQFAFAATAWEALFAVRPFPGHTPDQVRAAIASSPPAGSDGDPPRRVPRHVVAALRRALQPARDDRFPAMAPLLAALRRDPARARRNAGFAAAAVAAVAAAIIVPAAVRGDDRRADPCAEAGRAIASTWSPAAATPIRAAFAVVGQPWATRAGDAIVGQLDGWAARWAAQDRAVCRSAAAWSPSLRDRAVVCLARRRAELAAAADVLAHLAPDRASRGVDVIATLGAPETCADPAYLAAEVAPPADPQLAAAVAAQDPKVSRVRALLAAGRVADAQAEADALVPAATAIGDRALLARSRIALGTVLGVNRQYDPAAVELTEAYYLAREVGDGHTAALAAARTARVMLGLSRQREAGIWARLASIDAGAGGDPRLRVVAGDVAALVSRVQGELTAARAIADRALAEARAIGDANLIAQVLAERADSAGQAGDRAAAAADLEEAMAVIRRAYGDEHFALVQHGADLAFQQHQLGRFDDAIATARAAVALSETLFGADHTTTHLARGELATALGAANRSDEAVPMWDRIIAAEAPGSWELGSDLNNRAVAFLQLARYDDAIADWRRAIAIWTPLVDAGAPELAIVEGNIASAHLEAGRPAEAEAAAGRAIALFAHHPDHAGVASPLVTRGAARLARRGFAAARVDLDRALALRDRPDVAPLLRARTQLLHAEADAGLGDLARARALATAALAVLEGEDDALAARAKAVLARR